METKTGKASAMKEVAGLLFRSRLPVRIVNFITVYRIVTFPVILLLLLLGSVGVAKWLILASFMTDAVDGFLARKFNATSLLGSKLDSIGDDLTVLAATIGLLIIKFDFIREQWVAFSLLFMLFLIQVVLSFTRWGKMSTFHTYLAKVAAVVAAVFLLSVFFLDEVHYGLFYAALIITALDLVEEIILVLMLPGYESNVRGIYWVMRRKSR